MPGHVLYADRIRGLEETGATSGIDVVGRTNKKGTLHNAESVKYKL